MIFQEFPKWKYHATKDAVIVHNPDAESALGDDWAESPAAFAVREQVLSPEPAVKTTKKRVANALLAYKNVAEEGK